jgi:cytochrome b/b6/petD-like protein
VAAFETAINYLTTPALLLPGVALAVVVGLRARWLFTWRAGGAMAVIALALGALSLRNAHFRALAARPDNVAILVMLAAVTFFVWLALKQAHENDLRMAAGGEPVETPEYREEVLTWPHLVYIELLCTLGVLVVLIVWSLLVRAPLEAPANPAHTPNPIKAPWYFLGLQEMLVYFDPWIAGVLLPLTVVLGLCAIPYLDRNPRGAGYYTLKQRPFAVTVFLLGFVVLWIVPLLIGTFLRGPNWAFFGPFQGWDAQQVGVGDSVNLSELLYVRWLAKPLPESWPLREAGGIVLLVAYFALTPAVLGRTRLRKLREKLGAARYRVLSVLLLLMLLLPVKMLLRWLFEVKYIVSLPELLLSI